MGTASPDLSEFAALHRPKQPLCPIGEALTTLDETRREQLTAALQQPNAVITAQAISLWLEAKGFPGIKYGRVKSHRKGECSCAQA